MFRAYFTGNDLPIENSLCMTVEHIRAADNPRSFYQCISLSDQEIKSYHLSDSKVGTWQVRKCPGDHQFDYIKQGCTDKSKIRRQPTNCRLKPNAIGCQTSCQAANTVPDQMKTCDWLTAPLQDDANSNAVFLQCVPQSARSCGLWTPRQCAHGMIFDVRLQLCVPQQLMGCPIGSAPVSRCAQQPFVNSCPGQSRCTEEYQVCCLPLINQPSRYQPLQLQSVSVPNNLSPQLCPGNTEPPVAACSPMQSCPPGTICYVISGFCCSITVEPLSVVEPQPSLVPVIQRPQTPISVAQETSIPVSSHQIVIMCPNGSPGTQPCGFMEQCPTNSGCYRGVCCPLVCPIGQNAVGFCGQSLSITLSCSEQSTCMSGCCCQQQHQEPVRMPICRSGVTATSRCTIDQECGPGMECSSNGCCPIPFCPTGIQAVGKCPSGIGCPSTSVCANGLCCPSPRCSSGVIALRICVSSVECGIGFECANGGCCPLPLCPNNQVGSQRCGCCCPLGQQCVNGVCCPLPACSNGIISAMVCGPRGTCPHGMECINGGCCPLPTCPSGAQSFQRCQGTICPVGQNGVCCPLPICSTGQIAVQLCAFGDNACPPGYVCEGRGCCLEPLPLCPNGARTLQQCSRGIDCPPGFGCTAMGACCLLSLDPACPSNHNAICQCSPTSHCPPHTSCSMGTCCSSVSLDVYNRVPGTACQTGSQCNGFQTRGAQCMQSICVCVNGAASNGPACQQINPATLLQARSGCDQYGSPCKYVLSSVRRKPLFAPMGNITEQPRGCDFWYAVTTPRRCLWNSSITDLDPDSTCLPNEKCISGECRMKLWPGEYGCTSNDECSARCPNTFCSKTSDKNLSQCQCSNGKILYGRCFAQCPRGFHVKGANCEHDDEDHFWKDRTQQNSLRELLNSGSC
ncbi:unnamed protein product [Thelazia callipaeda]|uniref:Chitin-binding type-2 domain-containing protein n=1 Tax=Thelazia callipaeda TaxID=103827 RepID=A0A0N5D901_THECL|nr:unnamed protein product [Thelazia callipaeda]